MIYDLQKIAPGMGAGWGGGDHSQQRRLDWKLDPFISLMLPNSDDTSEMDSTATYPSFTDEETEI